MSHGGGRRGMKNKFNYYPVLSYINTGLRCPSVEPPVFDPIPLAKLFHAQSGCYISSHMGSWLGLMGKQVAPTIWG